MDSALLRERQQFKKKAAAIPAVEKRKSTSELDDQGGNKKRKLNTKYHNFSALAKVVQCLRTKYLEGNRNPATPEEILEETKQSDINPNVKSWLFDEALKENPKIKVVQNKFMFKPIYKMDDNTSLIKCLTKFELNGLGGMLWDDVVESLPNAENILKNLEKRKAITVLTRFSDKKKVLFRHEPKDTMNIDDDFKKLWNTIAVDALDDDKVTNYLDKQGMSSMKGEGLKRPMPSKKSKTRKKQSRKPKDNVHLADVLMSYDDNTLTQKGS